MTSVYRRNEISLFGTYFPLVGPVSVLDAAEFANKQVIGDYTKDSERIGSSWIMSDARGGIGIKDMREYGPDGRPLDVDRVWWSTSEINYNGHHTLPVRVADTGAPSSAAPALLIEYNNAMYAFTGTTVHLWSEGTATWGSSLNTQPALPTSGVVHKSKLYAACDTDFVRLAGATWTDGDTLGTAQPCQFMVEWQDKLFTLDNTGQLDYSVDEGVTWEPNAKSNLPTGSFTSMYTSRDASDNVVIYMGTKSGLYVLDFEAGAWRETELKLPFHDHACKGAGPHFDAAYVPSGMSLYKHQPGRNPGVDFVGLDADFGVPGAYNGSIIKILSSLNALFAMVDATAAVERDVYASGSTSSAAVIDDNEGYSAVFRWRNPGWSVVHLSTAAAEPIITGVVASADDNYRLWFGMDGKVWYIPLQITVQNPLEVSTYEFGASSETLTPWFDKDNSVAEAVGVRINGLYENMSSDEYAMLYYGLDGDDDTWTLLTNSDFPDGKIDVSGEVEFDLSEGAGLAFKSVRFKEELYRGSTTTKAPDRRWLRLYYLKLLTPAYSWGVRVDCSRNYRFKSARVLGDLLRTANATQTLGQFNFKQGSASEIHRVKIGEFKGVEVGGVEQKGIFDVQLVAP